MIRHQCSYWVAVTPSEPDSPLKHSLAEMLKILQESRLGEKEIGLVFEISDGARIMGQVDPDVGTIEECSDIADIVEELARLHYDYRFALEEIDEEDHSNGRTTVWDKGSKIIESFARIVPSGASWDKTTVLAIVDELKQSGHADLADRIHEKFSDYEE